MPTYVYDKETGKMVEGRATPRGGSGDGYRFSDRVYSDKPFKAPDGTIIDSRAKHRDYMKRAGVTTMDDFKSTWKDAAKKREAFYTGTDQHARRERKQDIARTIERLNRG
jgi:hypothetical protein